MAADGLSEPNAVAARPAAKGIHRLMTACLAPVDAASLAIFRIGFGLIMAGWALDYLRSGRLRELYELPKFHFTYFPFDFVRPWAGAGMSIFFVVLIGLAVCIAAGLIYRAASLLFAIGFTYFFLLDRANYQNHYYLIVLLSWTIALLPLHREWSLDVLNGNTRASPVFSGWMLGLVRFHVALPYIFGGIAKLDGDWFAGEPMRQVLAFQGDLPVIGRWLTTESAVQFFTWGGLLFDLAVVPLLLWRPTRLLAYLVALGFHAANAYLFNIHVFPWFMMFATTVFFDPSWPRKLLKLPAAGPFWKSDQSLAGCWSAPPRRTRLALGLLATYCAFHLIWPFRHHALGPQAAWTECGHFFSWRMMLRVKTSGLRYYVIDKTSGRIRTPDIHEFVNAEQSEKFSRDPEMILEFAHFLADRFRMQTGRIPAVHALVLTSLNGRKPQLLVDPEVDLAREPRGFHRRPWIIPLAEPLRREPWRVPLKEWEREVEIPSLAFLSSHASSSKIESAEPPTMSAISRTGVVGRGVMARPGSR